MWTGWNGLLHECCNSLTQQLLVEVNLSKTYWYSDFFNIWDNVRHINWILFSFIPIHTSVSFKWNCFNELAYIYFKVLNEWGLLPQCAIQMFWIIKNFWSVFKCLRGKKLNIYLSIYLSSQSLQPDLGCPTLISFKPETLSNTYPHFLNHPPGSLLIDSLLTQESAQRHSVSVISSLIVSPDSARMAHPKRTREEEIGVLIPDSQWILIFHPPYVSWFISMWVFFLKYTTQMLGLRKFIQPPATVAIDVNSLQPTILTCFGPVQAALIFGAKYLTLLLQCWM